MKEMIKLVPSFNKIDCPVFIGKSIINTALASLPTSQLQHSIFLVDKRVVSSCLRMQEYLRSIGSKVDVIELDVDESLKDFLKIYPIYGKLIQLGANRHSVLFAIGGGVVGDVAGFIASTYMRGMRWIGIPTTLLAQVDSSIGGKNGVNHATSKNMIGTIYQPWTVICDVDVLQTLSTREMVSGLGEIIKYGCAYQEEFFNKIASIWPSIISHQCSDMQQIVAFCVQEKLRVVQEDVLDQKGIRATLNFGHTIGHALEKVTGFQYFRHGEAVILGMLAAAHLSFLKGYLSKDKYTHLANILAQVPVPSVPKTIKPQEVIDAIVLDKKKSSRKQTQFVLLKDIGKTVLDDTIDNNDLHQVFHLLCEKF